MKRITQFLWAAVLLGAMASTVHAADTVSTAVPVGEASSASPAPSPTPSHAPGDSWLDNVSSSLPVHFGLAVSETYDDNIFLQPKKTYDWITRVTPSVAYILGDQEAANANYLSLFYAPTFLIYAENSSQSAVEQNVRAEYSHSWTKLRLGISQQFQYLADSTVDSNNITKRDIYTTHLTADYDYSDKLSLHNILSQTITDYDAPSNADTNEWTINSFFLYELTPKLKVGGGPLIGFLDQQFAPNQTYEQFLGHIQYQATGKITLALAGGFEFREYQSNAGDDLTPVFDLRADYQATESTSFYLNGHAETYASTNLPGENYQDILIQGGIRQRIIQKFFITLSGGYDNSTYQTISPNALNSNRDDNYFFGKAGVEWIPNNWLLVGGSYQYSNDNSSYAPSRFNDNQYTIRCELKY